MSARILLFGEFGVGNVGNDASADAAVRLLRQRIQAPQISLLTRGSERASTIFELPVLSTRRGVSGSRRGSRVADLLHLWRVVGDFDCIIVPGMGVLQAEGNRPRGMLLEMMVAAAAARARGIPFVWLLVGGGRHPSRVVRAWIAVVARLTSYRSYRDPMTRDGVRACGVDTAGDLVAPDIVVGDRAGSVTTSGDSCGPLVVGLIDVPSRVGSRMADATERATYLDRMVAIVTALAADGTDVVVPVADAADLAVAHAVADRVREASGLCIRVVPVDTFDALATLVAGSRAVVASRYHTLVAGGLAGIPLVALSHVEKDTALMEQMRLGSYVHDAHHLVPDKVVASVHSVMSNAEDVVQRLEAWRSESFQRFVASSDDLVARLHGWGLA